MYCDSLHRKVIMAKKNFYCKIQCFLRQTHTPVLSHSSVNYLAVTYYFWDLFSSFEDEDIFAYFIALLSDEI